MEDLKQIQEFFSKPLEENTTDWPKEVSSRYGDIIFRLVKVMSDRAKYELIDAETGKTWEEGGRVYGTVNQLKASAEDTIKPQGGRQSSQFESLNEVKRPEPDYKQLVKLLIMAFKHEPKSRFYFNRNNGVVYFDLIGGAAYSPKKSKMRDIFGGMNPIAVNREFGRADHHEEETIKQVEQLSKGKIKAEIKELGDGVLYKLAAVNEESVNEASKGALNYFNDLKYYYQKAFRYLDVEEREEYKQLTKDFFSRLQIDDKVRAVGLEESVNESTINELNTKTYRSAVEKGLERGDDKGREIAQKAIELMGKSLSKELKDVTLVIKPIKIESFNRNYFSGKPPMTGQYQIKFSGEGNLHKPDLNLDTKDITLFVKAKIGKAEEYGGWDSPVELDRYTGWKPITLQLSIRNGSVEVYPYSGGGQVQFTRQGARLIAKIAKEINLSMGGDGDVRHNAIKQFTPHKNEESVNEAIGDQIAVGNYVKTQHGDIYKRVEGTVGGRPAFVDVVVDKKGKLKVGKRKTGLHDSVKLTLVNKGELEESVKENSRFEKRLAKMAADEKEKRAKSPSYAAASKLDVDVEDFIEKGQSYGEFKKRLDKLKEDKKLTYNDFIQMVRDDMMAGSSPDEKPSDEQVRRRAKSYYNDYLQGASVDDLFEATKKEYDALLDKEHELTKAYSKDKTDANWKKLSDIRKKGKKLEKELEDQGLLEYNTGLDYHPSKEKSSSNSKKSSLKKVKDMIKRAVKEGDITVDDKTEFKLNLKHLLDKHIIQKEDLSDYEETEADYDKLYSNYAYKAVKEVFEEKGYSKYLKSKDNPKGETDGLTPDVLNKILMNVVKDIKETNQIDEGASTEEKRIAMSAIKRIAKYRGVGEDEARNDLIRAAKELGSLKEAVKEIFETIELGQNLNEELCPKGKAYIKKRQAAGEKSSAYLSGRAVKVCKGQMKG